MHDRGDNMDMEVCWADEMATAAARGETWAARMTLAKGAVAFRE
jgi:hypothetical protein